VIERETQDVEQYASTWIRHEESDPARTGPAFNRWLDWYQAAGIEAVGFGLITMRRSDRSSPWLCIDELHQAMDEPPGEAIRASFARRDWLADIGNDDQRLLEARLVVASDTRLEESRQVDHGRWVAVDQQLLQAGGLRYSGSIDPQGAGVVAGCDGQRRLGELVERLATVLGSDINDLVPQALSVVRRLIEQGFLAPEGGQGTG
jgi:hypothetical protein